jgi:hypothetical protein
MTTQALQSAVRRAYEAFGTERAPNTPLNVCTAGCCMPEDLEREMRTLPLRMLTARHFYEYCTGAMGDLVQPAAEVRYLLPRWLELVAAGDETHHSIELTFDRVGCCPEGSFTEEEIGVLNEFMLAFFDHHLASSGQRGLESDPLSLLIMADAAGLAVEPLLHHWLQHASPTSTLQFVQATYWGFWPKGTMTNAFADYRPELQSTFKAAFIAKLLRPDFLALVEQGSRQPGLNLALMTDAVFDHLNR